jgi:CBS-domain-containing membrane protein
VLRVGRWIGIEIDEASWRERLVATLGATVSILGIILVCDDVLDRPAGAMLIASMGASAVLVFAVPHGQLSQPWPVAGGHLVSALIGVGCARWLPNDHLAAALAVGLAVAAMHQLKCIHPPGGATALTAVIGGHAVTSRGLAFVVTPVLLNVTLMIAIGVAFNAWFPWRRYPAAWAVRHPVADGVEHEAVLAAIRSLDTFVDVTEDDLVELVERIRPWLAEAPQRRDQVAGEGRG